MPIIEKKLILIEKNLDFNYISIKISPKTWCHILIYITKRKNIRSFIIY